MMITIKDKNDSFTWEFDGRLEAGEGTTPSIDLDIAGYECLAEMENPIIENEWSPRPGRYFVWIRGNSVYFQEA